MGAAHWPRIPRRVEPVRVGIGMHLGTMDRSTPDFHPRAAYNKGVDFDYFGQHNLKPLLIETLMKHILWPFKFLGTQPGVEIV